MGVPAVKERGLSDSNAIPDHRSEPAEENP